MTKPLYEMRNIKGQNNVKSERRNEKSFDNKFDAL